MDLTTPDGPRPLIPSRRALAGLGLFAGYCAAAGPATATAIRTPEDGLVTGMVSYPSGDFDLPAYVARPGGRGRKPVVVVVSEIFGLHEYIRDVCRRLARQGYVAIAPVFFARDGDTAALTDFAAVRPIVARATNAQVMGDLDATIAWLDRQPFAAKDRIAITGFCWGGAVTYMAAAHSARFKAGVAWYGRLVKPAPDAFLGSENRLWPADVAGDLKAPVLGLYAENDSGIPLSSVEAMRAALNAAGKGEANPIIVYPGAQHGFHADYRPAFKADAAHDGWIRMLSWFQRNGV